MMESFNRSSSTVMHLDLNSCFATIEQQANPLLRGRPLVVAAYDSPGGCVLAASIEAKRLGIKTGLRVRDARRLYPDILVLEPDPAKYRHVHLALRRILRRYTNNFSPKSIDEFVLNFAGYPILRQKSLQTIGQEIKQRIKAEVGDWLMVSIGIGPSRFIAKTASNLKKPDGLEEINHANFLEVYARLKLTDLTGIAYHNELRLKGVGIQSVVDFYRAPLWKLKAAFASVNGYYWYLRLRGWEIDAVEFARRSYGNSFALPHSRGGQAELLPILQKLCEKTGQRLRAAGYKAKGISLFISYRNHAYWHKSQTLAKDIFDSRDLYQEAVRMLKLSNLAFPVHTLAVSCFNLKSAECLQYELFDNLDRKRRLTTALDNINNRCGDFVVTPARMVLTGDSIKDRIAFGGVREL